MTCVSLGFIQILAKGWGEDVISKRLQVVSVFSFLGKKLKKKKREKTISGWIKMFKLGEGKKIKERDGELK